MKLFKVLCVLALVFAVSAIAYAETQSVKISGEITQRAFARGNYDLTSGAGADDGATPAVSTVSTDWQTFLQSTVEVQVDADLTDNVAGTVRLINQRVWGANTAPVTNTLGDGIDPNSSDAYTVVPDLAYIELKEFLYSPLTLKIGRQDMWFGRGFIIGNSLTNPTDSLYAPEYTAVTSFDAVRATLDYDPYTIDAVYAKIDERNVQADDDTNLFGINIGRPFDSYNAEAEVYYWYKQDRRPTSYATTSQYYGNDVHTVGARGSFDPIEDWTVALEAALQGGQFLHATNQKEQERAAVAIDAYVETRMFKDDLPWDPILSLEYVYYSGEDVDNGDKTANWNSWDMMYRGRFYTAIREFQGSYYLTDQDGANASNTNQHQWIGTLNTSPIEDVTFTATYAHFWLDQNIDSTYDKKHVGAELDLVVNWDYTEDVSFNLLAGWFFPGNHFGSNEVGNTGTVQDGRNDIATDIVGTVKLSF